MKNLSFCLLFLWGCSTVLFAQKQPVKSDEVKASSTGNVVENNPRSLSIDSTITIKKSVTIRGQRVPYTITAGTIPVWNEDEEPVAGVFFTYYERSDISDRSSRPLVFSFNGGPGTPSVWMEIGYTGPRILKIDDEGYPVQPYGMKDNPHSILDVADIVYVDPVNTGFSRLVNKDIPRTNFFGVNADVKYLASWISTFISRYKRWASPKYLIGESYGTTRVAGLALELQNVQWIYLNGIILVSPTELGIERGRVMDAALLLPYYAATAWYHKVLPPDLQQRDLTAVLPEVEKFTIDEYLPALAKGGSLSQAERKQIAEKVARYSGLGIREVLQNNLSVSTNFFWKELLRDKGFTIGRLDSRYLGVDKKDGGERPDYNAELTAWLHAFTPAINIFLRDELNYKTELTYNMFGNVYPWDTENNKTGDNLRQAMAQNPNLYLLVQSGYYDGACDYFNSRFNLWQMDPGGKMQERMWWEGYRSGHMMYLRKEDLATSSQHLREFILKTIPKQGEGVKYNREK